MPEAITAASEHRREAHAWGKAFSGKAFWKVQGWSVPLIVFMSFFPRLFHIEEYAFFILLITSLAVAWRSEVSFRTSTPINVPLLLFLAWVLITIPFAMDPAYSFAEWRKLLVQAMVFYWILLVVRKNSPDQIVSRVLGAVAIGTLLLSSAALADFLQRGGTWRDRLIRAGAPSSDYNWLTTYLIIAIPLLVALAHTSPMWWTRVMSAVGTLIALVTQVATYTRAGWLAMVAQGLAFGMVTTRRIVILWVLGGGLLLGVGLVAASHLGYQRDTVDSWTMDARVTVWKLAVGEIIEHPIVGVGYGNNTFMKRFAGYPGTEKAAGYHNTFLMMAMGSGLPALALFVWMLVKIFRVLVSHAEVVHHHSDRYSLLIATAMVVVGFATRNFFDYMFAGSIAFLFWAIIATSLGASEEFQEKASLP